MDHTQCEGSPLQLVHLSSGAPSGPSSWPSLPAPLLLLLTWSGLLPGVGGPAGGPGCEPGPELALAGRELTCCPHQSVSAVLYSTVVLY